MLTSDWLLSQFEAIDVPMDKGTDSVKIRCPFHAGGLERTPSCRVNLSDDTGYEVGFFHCYGCGESGRFKPLADALSIPFTDDPDDKFSLLVSNNTKNCMLGDSVGNKVDSYYTHFPLWNPKKKFRGISGKLAHRLGFRELYTDYGTKAYIPVFFMKEEVGGITASLEKSRNSISYIYTKGPWVKRYLYPYDYADRMLKRQSKKGQKKIISISEGTRDALNPIQYGLPSVMNLGGKTTWSAVKADYIAALEPDIALLAFDDDEIGKAVTKLAYRDLKGKVKNVIDLDWQSVKKALTKKEKESLRDKDGKLKLDMGGMPERIIKLIHGKLQK